MNFFDGCILGYIIFLIIFLISWMKFMNAVNPRKRKDGK